MNINMSSTEFFVYNASFASLHTILIVGNSVFIQHNLFFLVGWYSLGNPLEKHTRVVKLKKINHTSELYPQEKKVNKV